MKAGRRTDPEKTVVFMNELLKKYNLTVQEIAGWLGISENQVYGWRGGRIGFKKMHLLAMAAIAIPVYLFVTGMMKVPVQLFGRKKKRQ